ncbi:MAG: hypothetical protein H6730_23795 [Deltaproteobacteria bacterium]|nr:hypothetical protein [Deltaproteobacteria bacterium]
MLARGDCEHTSFYCEENVHRLLGRPELAELPRWVVFISNVKNSCALWQQRAAGAGRWVIWDYHVVVMARHDDGIRVYDLDSRLTFPTPLAAYVTGTFPFATRMPASCRPASGWCRRTASSPPSARIDPTCARRTAATRTRRPPGRRSRWRACRRAPWPASWT